MTIFSTPYIVNPTGFEYTYWNMEDVNLLKHIILNDLIFRCINPVKYARELKEKYPRNQVEASNLKSGWRCKHIPGNDKRKTWKGKKTK